MNAVATITPAPPRSVLVTMSGRYGMEPAAFEATLRKTVCKGEVSREEFAAFLLVAQEYGLNPLTKELYAFPAKGGGIQPIVSIDGWSRIINDHPAFDGMEFEDTLNGADVLAVTCRMFRKDRSRPVEATEYMAECKRSTDVWRTWPRRMLRHKAMIQCARYAFGFSGIVDPDEYERQVEQVRQVPPAGLAARLQAGPASPEGFTANQSAEPAHDPETGEVAEFVDAPADDGLPVLDDTPDDDFPGDAPAETKPDLSGMKTGADLLAEQTGGVTSLNERIRAFKAECEGKGTADLSKAWRRSSTLRNDIEAADPDSVEATNQELESWFNGLFDAAENKEKGAA